MTANELSKLLPLVMRSRDYVEINGEQHKLLASIEGASGLIHLENETGTVNWKSETLPDCAPGSYRLWNITDWRTTENVRIKTKARDDIDREARYQAALKFNALKEQLVTYFESIKVPRIVTEKNILANADTEQLETIIDGLRRNGAKI
jgi:hypothetical protein